jgi:hypothetical protein
MNTACLRRVSTPSVHKKVNEFLPEKLKKNHINAILVLSDGKDCVKYNSERGEAKNSKIKDT